MRKRLTYEEFQKRIMARRGNRAASDKGGVFVVSCTIQKKMYDQKQILRNARENTSECVTIKPEKEVFEAIVAEMMNRPMKIS